MLVPCVKGKVALQHKSGQPHVVGRNRRAPFPEVGGTRTPDAGLFNFDGFLRPGVGDPRQLQPAVKATFRAPTVANAGRARSSR